ncbi:hypothetical protein [Rubellicoccus peritrichatus]|uniref:Uncharacterized protein n=1 Tax=Rubellicoccus peritrichatus TaxID=3080537 RepID=A0AAQ3QVT6_9BACT|nr:hypothetical protein [Puniceicoccus sp. CR14]WOO41192.1 hypothetical protein RZN69_21435 [Puniceicoccus sp. CR14]
MFKIKSPYFCLLTLFYASTASSDATMTIDITEDTDTSTVTVEISGTVRFGELVNRDAIIFEEVTPTPAMISGYGQIAIQGTKNQSTEGSKQAYLYQLPTDATWIVTDSDGNTVSTTDLSDLTASTLNFGTATDMTTASSTDSTSNKTFAMWLNSDSNHPGYLGFSRVIESGDSISTTNIYENTTLDDLGLTTEYSYTLLYGENGNDSLIIQITSDTDSSELYDVSNDWVFISDVLAEGTWLWSTANATWVFISASFITDDEDENNNARFAYVLDQENQNSSEWLQLKTTSSSVE